MLAEEVRMSRSISQRNYSHCPLKKRPVTILKEDKPDSSAILAKPERPMTPPTPRTPTNFYDDKDDNPEPENLSTKPEDLSKTGNYPTKAKSPVVIASPLPRKWELHSPPPPVMCQLDATAATALRYTPREDFQPLNLNTTAEHLPVSWHKPSPQYPPGYVPLSYHYPEIYRYPSPLYAPEQLSPYNPREVSCSPRSARSPLPVSHNDYRYLPYSPEASSLSPASSHGSSYPCTSPPLAAAEDLTSPGSISSDSGISATSFVSKKKKESSVPRHHCPDCRKSYSTYSGLSKHQQFHCAAAEGSLAKKSFTCKFCPKIYTSLGALKMHIRTHTLPCKCNLCGKAFSRPWLLQGHIRTHTGEKPFSCHHCRRAFADRSNLRAHLQTHSDVKKYSCSSCSKTFSRMSLLTKHMEGGCGCSVGMSVPIHYDYAPEEMAF